MPSNTLIIRNHRIGDALLVLPLVISLAEKYNEDSFTLITNERFENLSSMMPDNVSFIPMISKNADGGIFRGLKFVFKRWLFLRRLVSTISSFDKIGFLQYETFEKDLHKKLVKKDSKVQVAITDETDFRSQNRLLNKCNDGLTMIGLYKDTFAELGYLDLVPMSDPSNITKSDLPIAAQNLGITLSKKLVLIAPFSREQTKIYPLDKMEQVIAHFTHLNDEYQVLILGGGLREEKIVNGWIEKYPDLISLINKLPFSEESIVLAKGAIVLAMDSANMHLASLLHIPVVTIWGATSPQNGYYPLRDDVGCAIIKNLPCQPCSIFGENECTNAKLHDCLDIDPKIVIKEMESILEKR